MIDLAANEMDLSMNEEEFNNQYLGYVKPDKRYLDLVDRLAEYYRDTPDLMNGREITIKYKEFKKWSDERGYTNEELSYAKKSKRFMNEHKQ